MPDIEVETRFIVIIHWNDGATPVYQTGLYYHQAMNVINDRVNAAGRVKFLHSIIVQPQIALTHNPDASTQRHYTAEELRAA